MERLVLANFVVNVCPICARVNCNACVSSCRSFVLTDDEMEAVRQSCDLMYCGDAVAWTEFRRGTRGAMRMRWPSGAIRMYTHLNK